MAVAGRIISRIDELLDQHESIIVRGRFSLNTSGNGRTLRESAEELGISSVRKELDRSCTGTFTEGWNSIEKNVSGLSVFNSETRVNTSSSTDGTSARSQTSGRTIAISGATGLVGGALLRELTSVGNRVLTVSRQKTASADCVEWTPADGFSDPEALEGLDAFVHLAGENIAAGRWNSVRKARIRDSRVDGTRHVAQTLAALDRQPNVLICASAIGYYGDRGDTELDESSAPGKGFLPEVCRHWEEAAAPAVEAGIRVVNLRIGVVISRNGGALPQMLTPFRLGVGGPIGGGRQYWSWISIDDVVGAIQHVIEHSEMTGPVNCVAPQSVTNNEFTRMLGKVLRRPAVFPLPGFMVRIMFGEMAEELLLASTRVVPRYLQKTGYSYRLPNLIDAVEAEIRVQSSGRTVTNIF